MTNEYEQLDNISLQRGTPATFIEIILTIDHDVKPRANYIAIYTQKDPGDVERILSTNINTNLMTHILKHQIMNITDLEVELFKKYIFKRAQYVTYIHHPSTNKQKIDILELDRRKSPTGYAFINIAATILYEIITHISENIYNNIVHLRKLSELRMSIDLKVILIYQAQAYLERILEFGTAYINKELDPDVINLLKLDTKRHFVYNREEFNLFNKTQFENRRVFESTEKDIYKEEQRIIDRARSRDESESLKYKQRRNRHDREKKFSERQKAALKQEEDKFTELPWPISRTTYVYADLSPNGIYMINLNTGWMGIFKYIQSNGRMGAGTMFKMNIFDEGRNISAITGPGSNFVDRSALLREYEAVPKFALENPYTDDYRLYEENELDKDTIIGKVTLLAMFVSKLKLKTHEDEVYSSLQDIFDPNTPMRLAQLICDNNECHEEAKYTVSNTIDGKYCSKDCFEIDFK